MKAWVPTFSEWINENEERTVPYYIMYKTLQTLYPRNFINAPGEIPDNADLGVEIPNFCGADIVYCVEAEVDREVTLQRSETEDIINGVITEYELSTFCGTDVVSMTQTKKEGKYIDNATEIILFAFLSERDALKCYIESKQEIVKLQPNYEPKLPRILGAGPQIRDTWVFTPAEYKRLYDAVAKDAEPDDISGIQAIHTLS